MNTLFKAYCRIYQGVYRVMMPLLPWRKPSLLSGSGSLKELPCLVKEKGLERVLIVTDSFLAGSGLMDPLIHGLDELSVVYTVYDKVIPNPTIENIEEALKLYKEINAQCIIAFGGGSSMDCAKAVGARAVKPNKPVSKMKGQLKILKRLPTFFAVPTTAGTGSEATVAAVICDPSINAKYAINDPALIPDYAVLDPLLTVGLPKHITSTTGMDALTHAVEAYVGHSTTKETREMSEKATKLIFDYLKRAYDDGKDIEARQNMQVAAYYAGIAFTRSYVGNVHAMAHTLGGFYHTPHGLANSVILPYILDFYGETVYAPLSKLADIVGIGGKNEEEKAKAFIAEIKAMNAYMNIPLKISGIKDEDIPKMAERAFAEANPLYPVPKIMSKEDIAAMFNTIKE